MTQKYLILFYPKGTVLNKQSQQFTDAQQMENFVKKKTYAGFICEQYEYKTTFSTQTTIINQKE